MGPGGRPRGRALAGGCTRLVAHALGGEERRPSRPGFLQALARRARPCPPFLTRSSLGAMSGHSFSGSCHCGNLTLHFEATRAAPELPVRQCGCTFCARHQPRYTSDPQGR